MSQPHNSDLQCVLFDLDDTLYDHLHSARHGLIALSQRYPALQQVPIRELENRYSTALESIHLRLLSGEVSQSEARTRRMQQLFASFGLSIDNQTAMDEYTQFRRDYDTACRVVAGTHELLQHLNGLGLRLAVITNNLVSEQVAKLKQLELTDYFDVVAISEEVGVAKPARKIFDVTLDRLSLPVSQVVLVGDSLTSDIAGALGVGMRCVWIKRRPDATPHAPFGVPTIDEDFSDLEYCAKIILG